MLRNIWVTPCSRRRSRIYVKSALGKVFSVILLGFTVLFVCACVLIFFNLVFWFCLSVCVYSGFCLQECVTIFLIKEGCFCVFGFEV
jgi:hypothetical protein